MRKNWLKTLMVAVVPLFAAQIPAAHALEYFEGGWYSTRGPVPVLHLEGSIEDVARSHGALLKRHPEGRVVIEHFANLIPARLRDDGKYRDRPITRGLLEFLFQHFVRNLIIDHVPERYQAGYREFAAAAGLPERAMWDALTLPDAAMRALSFSASAAAPALPTNLGCTSIIWNSGNSSVLHGRNLDYSGVGIWDRHQLILHVVPSEGLAHVAVSALGIPTAGLTAFNEAGLSLAVHQLNLSDTRASGTPMPVISAEIIRNARSIDDAITIIRGFPRAAGWAYVLSQGRDRAVIETSANELAIRRSSEPFFFQTNHVSSPALQKYFLSPSPGSYLDSFSRSDWLERRHKAGSTRDWAGPERMAGLLARTARLDNIQSVVIAPSRRRLWVATGDELTAPASGRFTEYRWSDLRSPAPPEISDEELGSPGANAAETKLRGYLRKALAETGDAARSQWLSRFAAHARKLESGQQLIEGSWRGYYLRAFHELSRNLPATPEALQELLIGIDSALRDGELASADNDTKTQQATKKHYRLLGKLMRARLLDLLDRRSEALFEYAVIAKTAQFEQLTRAARRGQLRPFTVRAAKTMSIDWAGIDLYRY